MRVRCDAEGIGAAAAAVRSGGVVVFPTDTVYGIGCDPYDAAAVGRIYAIKSRDRSKPLPVLVKSAREASAIASLGAAAGIAERFWPGALTIIAELADAALAVPLGLEGGVAVRVPGCGCTLGLLERCGPLVGTSANVSGEPPFSDPAMFPAGLECDVFVDGGVTGGTESTIIDARGGAIRVVREGAVPAGEIPGA